MSVGLLWLLVRRLDWVATFTILSRVELRVALLASACTIVLIGILALRWAMFLRQQGLFLPFRTVLSLTWAGQFFNSVLPGSTGGDAIKILHLCRMMPDRKAAAAVSVIIDRFSALIALAVLATLSLLFGPTAVSIEFLTAAFRFRWWWVFVILLVAGVAVAAIWLLRSTRWVERMRRLARVFADGIKFDRTTLGALLLAFAVHLANFAIAFLFARALGIAVSYVEILLFMAVVLLLVMLPVTINGHGLREVLLIFYFTHFGLAPDDRIVETAVGFSLLLVANDLLWALPGGLWYLATVRGPGRLNSAA